MSDYLSEKIAESLLGELQEKVKAKIDMDELAEKMADVATAKIIEQIKDAIDQQDYAWLVEDAISESSLSAIVGKFIEKKMKEALK